MTHSWENFPQNRFNFYLDIPPTSLRNVPGTVVKSINFGTLELDWADITDGVDGKDGPDLGEIPAPKESRRGEKGSTVTINVCLLCTVCLLLLVYVYIT